MSEQETHQESARRMREIADAMLMDLNCVHSHAGEAIAYLTWASARIEELDRVTAERDKLIAEWPGLGHGRPIDFDHGSYIVTRWDERRKFESATDAVRAAAGINREPAKTG